MEGCLMASIRTAAKFLKNSDRPFKSYDFF
jgi:hypothetical protein